MKLKDIIREKIKKTTENNQHIVLTSSQNGIVTQEEYFNRNVSSNDTTGYNIIEKGQFTFRSMSDTGYFYINLLKNHEIGIVSPAYPVFEIIDTSIVDPEYLELFFRSTYFLETSKKLSKGSTRRSLKYKQLAEIEIDLKPIEEQKKIVNDLKTIRIAIENRKQEYEDVDNLIGSTFNSLFFDIISNGENEKKLIEVADFIDYRGKTPTKTNTGIPLITAKNVKKNYFSIEPREFISEEEYSTRMTRGIPEVGDVLFTTEAPLGNVALIPDGLGNFSVGQRIITMKPNKEIVNSEYLKYIIAHNTTQEKINQRSTGSTVLGIKAEYLKKITVPIAPMHIQNVFSKKYYKCEEAKKLLEKDIEDLNQLYNRKMNYYFN